VSVFLLGNKNDEAGLQSYRRTCCPGDGFPGVVLGSGAGVGWFCVLFENCTVDASIFVVSV
jgi:hypothetical protein